MMTRPMIRWAIVAALVLLIGYEQWRIRAYDRQLIVDRRTTAAREQQFADQQRRLEQAKHDLVAAEGDLRVAEGNRAAAAETPHAAEIEMRLERMRQVRQLFAQRPAQQIPELQLLSDADWLRLAQQTNWATEDETREAMAEVRDTAKSKFTSALAAAMKKFTTNNGGLLPTDLAQLAAFYDGTIPPGTLARYQLRLSGAVAEVPRGLDPIQEAVPIDAEYDSRMTVGARGSSGSSSPWGMTEIRDDIFQAQHRLPNASSRESDNDPSQLLPYLQTPVARDWATAWAAFRQAGGKGQPEPEQLLSYVTLPATRQYIETLIARKKRWR
jgi:hypothetical protein